MGQSKEKPDRYGGRGRAGDGVITSGSVSDRATPKSAVRSSEQLPQASKRDQHEGNSNPDDNNAFDPVEFHCWPKKSPGDDARNRGAGEYGENPSQHYGLF